MNINLKQTIEQGKLSKLELLEKAFKEIQNFYINELLKSKETLENIERVIKQNPSIIKKEESK